MKDKLTPQAKKELSYKKDHRTHTGEDDRKMRRAWASRKKRVNRKYRRKTYAALRKALGPERIDALIAGDDPTTRELIRKGLTRDNNSRKWGVTNLREAVDKKLERRTAPRETNRQRKERLAQLCSQRITDLERDPHGKTSLELLGKLRGGEARLRDFLADHPESKRRLSMALKILRKEEQKQANQAKRKAEEKRKWRSPTARRQHAQ